MKSFKILFLLFILFSCFNLIFAQEMYRINVSETVEINEWGLCHQVTNNGFYDLAIFTKYPFEWYTFNQSPPLGVTFEDCGDGYLWVQNDGIYQSNNGGTYSKLYGTEGWHNTKDGDMVVIDAEQIIVDSDAILTTQYRCRGLLIYAKEAIIDGTISMTGKGGKANPDDVDVTIYTPVPPSDKNPVPSEGLVIRRDKSDWSDITSTIISNANANSVNDFKGSHSSNNLFYGTGNKSVKRESEQSAVSNGLVIKIPKVGGDAGLSVTHSTTYVKGNDGSTIMFGTGGGGSGNVYHWDDDGCRSSPSKSGNGAVGTIFSGGSGGGGGNCGSGTAAQAFGGNGGSTGGNCHGCPYGVGGFGNDNGGGAYWLSDANTGKPTGTGGLLILDVEKLILNGKLEANGYSYGSGFWDPSWPYGSNDQRVLGSSGGGSGGGVVVALYKDVSSVVSPSNVQADSPYLGGGAIRNGITFVKGGDGSAVGPIRIDSNCSGSEILYDGICQDVQWIELGDWGSCSVSCGGGIQTQTVQCETDNGDVVADNFCSHLSRPIDTKSCNEQICFSTICNPAGGFVLDAAGTEVCSFEPNVNGHNCTTLNCQYDVDTNSHLVAWECPQDWYRYENWGSYNEYCWMVDWSWNRVSGNWVKYSKATSPTYCNGGPYSMAGVWKGWGNDNAPIIPARTNIWGGSDSYVVLNGYDRYFSNTGVYGGAATGDGLGQVKAYGIMDSIGCLPVKSCGTNKVIYDDICEAVEWVELGDWGSCSASCGGGIQTQTVECRTQSGVKISDSFCSELSKLSETKICNSNICLNSCKDILDAGQSTGNGIYEISVYGTDGTESIDVYCDMTHKGGGWTLIGVGKSSGLQYSKIDSISLSSPPLSFLSDELFDALIDSSNEKVYWFDWPEVPSRYWDTYLKDPDTSSSNFHTYITSYSTFVGGGNNAQASPDFVTWSSYLPKDVSCVPGGFGQHNCGDTSNGYILYSTKRGSGDAHGGNPWWYGETRYGDYTLVNYIYFR